MLLLFETAAGYALFKVLNKGKLESTAVRLMLSTSEARPSFVTYACLPCMLIVVQDFSADFDSLEKAQQVDFCPPPPLPPTPAAALVGASRPSSPIPACTHLSACLWPSGCNACSADDDGGSCRQSSRTQPAQLVKSAGLCLA